MNRDWDRVFDALLSGSPAEWVGFVVALVVIAFAIRAVTRYRASLHGDTDPAAEEALLARRVREMRDRGEVSEVEYRSLKGRLGQPGGGNVSTRKATAAGEAVGSPGLGDVARFKSGAKTDGVDPGRPDGAARARS